MKSGQPEILDKKIIVEARSHHVLDQIAEIARHGGTAHANRQSPHRHRCLWVCGKTGNHQPPIHNRAISAVMTTA